MEPYCACNNNGTHSFAGSRDVKSILRPSVRLVKVSMDISFVRMKDSALQSETGK
jgi:hypothetical protein